MEKVSEYVAYVVREISTAIMPKSRIVKNYNIGKGKQSRPTIAPDPPLFVR